MKIPKQKPPEPQKPVPLPTIDDATVDARKRAALAEMKTRKGRGATYLSGGSLGDATGSTYRPMLS